MSESENNRVVVRGRLSFGTDLWQKKVFNGVVGDKYGCTILVPKDDPVLDKIKAVAMRVAASKFGGEKNIPKSLFAGENYTVKDGDLVDYDGYEGHMAISAAHSIQPRMLDRQKRPVKKEDGVIYSGCYCDFVIEPWVQMNNYGKVVRFSLYVVRFVEDGEPFGAGAVPQGVEDDLEDFDDDDDDGLADL